MILSKTGKMRCGATAQWCSHLLSSRFKTTRVENKNKTKRQDEYFNNVFFANKIVTRAYTA